MADEREEELPPLGEATPHRRSGPDVAPPWYRRLWVVGLACLVVGALLGFGLAAIVDGGDEDTVAIGEAGEVDRSSRTPPSTTTTTVVAVPPECVEAMRSAQQSLGVLDQGFQGLRRLNVGDVERVLADLEEVRRNLSERVRECLESA